jgi:glycosyltransferase involved in cell wall biosynthesis
MYPPTLNQANLLARRGLRVGLIDLSSDSLPDTALDSSIKHWMVHRAWNSKTEKLPARLRRFWNWLRFFQACKLAIRDCSPKVVIGYDTHGCVFVKPGRTTHRIVYHFHELPEPEPSMGSGPRHALSRVVQYSRHADLVVFSDEMRAVEYQRETCLPAVPKVVMNCPVRMDKVPASSLCQELAAQGMTGRRVVCYLGSVGVNQGLFGAARSMRHWPLDAIFVLVGAYSEEVRERILCSATEAGAAHRILFLGPRPHTESLALAAGSDVGLSLIQPNTRNLLYSAGAVNKRFEYMALGLPQVTNNGVGVKEIIEKNQCGLCVDPSSPQEIGQAVTQLLEDDARRNLLSRNARACHLQFYNYQTQFAEVASWIETISRPQLY